MIKEHQLDEFTESGGCREFLLPGVQDAGWEKIQRSLHYMMANLNRPLQVSTLAAEANISTSHYFALFKRITGFPPMDYFTRLRMRHARRLLESSSASVKEVAAALGYDDPFYFSRVFKSVSAVAPAHYRGLCREVRRELNGPLEPKELSWRRDSMGEFESNRLSTGLGHSAPATAKRTS